MHVLVTGGAGYIGSHTVRELERSGHRVTVLDNLTTGHRAAVRGRLVVAHIADQASVAAIARETPIDGVIHFAASAAAGESVTHPGEYLRNNVEGTRALLDGLVAVGVRRFVFSSSCSVYGQPRQSPVIEDAPTRPESPYGESKLMCERMLPWYERAHGLRFVALRYFNAAGASLDGALGDDVRPATRIIPAAFEAALGKRPHLALYGDDYDTPDGTCIRDYVHVEDLARAHALALEYLAAARPSDVFNLGTARGYSNREVIETVKEVTGSDFAVAARPRRPGDPARVVADPAKGQAVLGWNARHQDLRTMIRTSWEWRRRHPDGYRD